MLSKEMVDLAEFSEGELTGAKTGSEVVTLPNGEKVRVQWREFQPHQRDEKNRRKFTQEAVTPDPDKAVLYFSGWPMEAKNVAVADLPRAFANDSGAVSIAVDTTPDRVYPDFKNEMGAVVETVIKSLKDRGVKDITLSGQSQGGVKAAELAVLLREMAGKDPNLGIKVDGLVLMNVVSFYDQRPLLQLGKNFVSDTVFKTAKLEHQNESSKAAQKEFQEALKSKTKFVGGIGRFIKVFWNELKNMASKNPLLSKIDVPVVVVEAENDLVSDYLRMTPVDAWPVDLIKTDKETMARWKEMTEEQIKNDSEYQERKEELANTRRTMAENTRMRQDYLKEKTLQSAPDISLLIASATHRDEGQIIRPEDNAALHNSMPVYDFEQAAQVSLYLLRRNKRPSKS